jgi:hypothetical protein
MSDAVGKGRPARPGGLGCSSPGTAVPGLYLFLCLPVITPLADVLICDERMLHGGVLRVDVFIVIYGLFC